MHLGGKFMISLTGRSFISVCVVSCYVTLFAGAGLTKEDEVASLKKQLKAMQQQTQKLLLRIERIERKSERSRSGNSGQEPAQNQAKRENASAPKGAQSNPTTSDRARSISRAFNPAVSVNGLFLGGWASSVDAGNELAGLDFQNGFNLQEAEFRFTSDVDPYFNADMTVAVAPEGDVELEEGFVTSNQLPGDIMPRGLSLKIGKFFTDFGKHNLLHSHQFPFIDRPLVSESVFGDEGLNEPAVGLSYLFPVPWFSEFTFQGMQGDNSNLFVLSDDASPQGAFLGHWKNFFDLSDESTLEFGNSYVGGRNSGSGYSQAIGVDLTLKWIPLKRAQDRALIWQNEYIYSSVDRDDSARRETGGLYTSLQYRLSRLWWLQGRYDLLGAPNSREGMDHKWTLLAALVPSEFSALRLQYSRTQREFGDDIDQILFQLNYTLGSHPAHKY